MAAFTVGELAQHSRRMRLTMAVLAFWHCLMLVWMALGTTELMVLGLALDQQIKLFFMASAADLG
jgi:hypothetical protein